MKDKHIFVKPAFMAKTNGDRVLKTITQDEAKVKVLNAEYLFRKNVRGMEAAHRQEAASVLRRKVQSDRQ